MSSHAEQPELARILGWQSQSLLYGYPPSAVQLGNHEVFATDGSGNAITPDIDEGELLGRAPLGTISGKSMATLAGANFLDYTLVRKSMNESVSNLTSLQDDNELLFEGAADTDYIIDMYVDYTAHSSGDLKYDFTGPSGASINVSETTHVFVLGWQNTNHTTGFGSAKASAGVGAIHVAMHFMGTISINSTSGTVNWRFAQNSSHATATIVYAGSYLRVMKVH